MKMFKIFLLAIRRKDEMVNTVGKKLKVMMQPWNSMTLIHLGECLFKEWSLSACIYYRNRNSRNFWGCTQGNSFTLFSRWDIAKKYEILRGLLLNFDQTPSQYTAVSSHTMAAVSKLSLQHSEKYWKQILTNAANVWRNDKSKFITLQIS